MPTLILHAGDELVAQDLRDLRSEGSGVVGQLLDTVQVNRLGHQLLSRGEQMHLVGDVGQIENGPGSAVAVAHHGHGLVPEERPIAVHAVGHAPCRQLLLTRHADGAVAGAHGQDDGFGLVLPVLRLEAEGVAQRHDLLHLIRLVLRPELLGLGQHPLRELYALNAIRKAGVVFIEAAHGLLRAVDIAQNQRLLSASRAVHGSGQPSRACSYYDDIMQANITIKKPPFKVDKGYVAREDGARRGFLPAMFLD